MVSKDIGNATADGSAISTAAIIPISFNLAMALPAEAIVFPIASRFVSLTQALQSLESSLAAFLFSFQTAFPPLLRPFKSALPLLFCPIITCTNRRQRQKGKPNRKQG